MIFCELAFGDRYCDGHGQYRNLIVITDNYESVQKAQEKIKSLNLNIANDYHDGTMCEDAWKLLLESGYTLESLAAAADDIEWDEYKTLEEAYNDFFHSGEEVEYWLNIDAVIDIYVHLLRYFGAEFTVVNIEKTIDCYAGYGCFYE